MILFHLKSQNHKSQYKVYKLPNCPLRLGYINLLIKETILNNAKLRFQMK